MVRHLYSPWSMLKLTVTKMKVAYRPPDGSANPVDAAPPHATAGHEFAEGTLHVVASSSYQL